jgi:predicted transcriptional regulator
MILRDILKLLEGNVLCGEERLGDEVNIAFASDLMSDVLTLHTGNLLLITGLSNIQTIRTAEIADISYILLVRNKKANPAFIELASENNQVIIETPYSMFRACGILYKAGLKAVF